MTLTEKQFNRFCTKIVIEPISGCWFWTGSLDSNGYPRVNINSINRRAHIISYEHFKGAVPLNMDCHHVCKNKHCVNPNHIKVISRYNHKQLHLGENIKAQQTHCINGHEFTEENTYYRCYRNWTQRACNTCRRETSKRFRLTGGMP